MQILPIIQFNQNNNKRVSNPSFQALKPHYLRSYKGNIVPVPLELERKLANNSEIKKAVKYFETIGKDLTYYADMHMSDIYCDISISTIDPSKSIYKSESRFGEFSRSFFLNIDTNKAWFKAEDFIKEYENFVELKNKRGLIGNINQAIQSANAKSEPAQGIANLNKADYQRKNSRIFRIFKIIKSRG